MLSITCICIFYLGSSFLPIEGELLVEGVFRSTFGVQSCSPKKSLMHFFKSSFFSFAFLTALLSLKHTKLIFLNPLSLSRTFDDLKNISTISSHVNFALDIGLKIVEPIIKYSDERI